MQIGYVAEQPCTGWHYADISENVKIENLRYLQKSLRPRLRFVLLGGV